MKIILSRKGFDSKYGGCASPILPGGTLLSLPIPSKSDELRYSEIEYEGRSLYEMIKELHPGSRITDRYTCHLDPDIRNYRLSKEWWPLFGQANQALRHLDNNGVNAGDLFLFFGWFRHTEFVDGRLRFVKSAPNLHIIFGYFQIGEIYRTINEIPEEFEYHPHANNGIFRNGMNSIYAASENLSLDSTHPGASILNYDDSLVLTKKNMSRSKWNLPDFFRDVNMTYHTKASFRDGYFQSAAIGQEFVINADEKVRDWALNKINKGIR